MTTPTDQYVAAVAAAIESLPMAQLRTICPECSRPAKSLNGHPHTTVTHSIFGPVAVVGCEGYWVVDPNLVGIDAPNWTPIETCPDCGADMIDEECGCDTSDVND